MVCNNYFIISLKINVIFKLMYCNFEHYILHEKLQDRLCLKSYTNYGTNAYLSLYSFSRNIQWLCEKTSIFIFLTCSSAIFTLPL